MKILCSTAILVVTIGLTILPAQTIAKSATSTSIKTGDITTNGPCSAVVVGPRQPIRIECKTLGLTSSEIETQKRQYASILNNVRQAGLKEEQILALIQQIVASTNEVHRLINTQISFTYEILPDEIADELERKPPPPGGKNVAINIRAVPSGNPAKSLQLMTARVLVRGFAGQTDLRPWKLFTDAYIRNHKNSIGTDTGLGVAKLETVHIGLSSRDLLDIRYGRARLYIMAAANWKNVSGSHDTALFCQYAAQEFVTSVLTIDVHSVLHECPTGDLDQ